MTRQSGRRQRRLSIVLRTCGLTGLLLVGAGLVGGPSAHAGMHDAETCRRIKSEHDTLAGSGIREMMAKGPEWAKANLAADRMLQIRRYLALEEDVRFRCPLGKARPDLEAAENEAGSTTTLQPGDPTPVPKSVPRTASKAKPTGAGTGGQQADKADRSGADRSGADRSGAEQGSGKSPAIKTPAAKASTGAIPASKTKADIPKADIPKNE